MENHNLLNLLNSSELVKHITLKQLSLFLKCKQLGIAMLGEVTQVYFILTSKLSSFIKCWVNFSSIYRIPLQM